MRALGRIVLGPGVIAHNGSAVTCNFPFRIYGVPGGSATYGIAVDNRPPVTFTKTDLAQNRPAVITVPA